MSSELQASLSRQFNLYKHRKKQAANDAQLLMNRIALLQKEEERAKKKIETTKSRAQELIDIRVENERRLQAFVTAVGEEQKLQNQLMVRNKEFDQQNRKARLHFTESLRAKKRNEVTEMQMEKKQLAKKMLQDQEHELRIKQKKHEEVRRKEEEARLKREREKQEQERRIREYFERKAREEEDEARKAEQLVKLLEQKEREWIERLQQTQQMQETAYHQLESALQPVTHYNQTLQSTAISHHSDFSSRLPESPFSSISRRADDDLRLASARSKASNANSSRASSASRIRRNLNLC